MKTKTRSKTKRPSWRTKGRLARPTLRFTPTAWAKLLRFRDLGPSEIGGFGIAHANDPLLVTDIRLVRQTCTACTTVFDDAAVADFFDEQVDCGLKPAQFGRIWCHTHPGNSAEPSGTDEETFDRAFGGADFAVMFILATGGARYARLRFAAGPGGSLHIPTRVDYSETFAATDHEAWAAEYAQSVTIVEVVPNRIADGSSIADIERRPGIHERPIGTSIDDFDLFSREDFWHGW